MHRAGTCPLNMYRNEEPVPEEAVHLPFVEVAGDGEELVNGGEMPEQEELVDGGEMLEQEELVDGGEMPEQ